MPPALSLHIYIYFPALGRSRWAEHCKLFLIPEAAVRMCRLLSQYTRVSSCKKANCTGIKLLQELFHDKPLPSYDLTASMRAPNRPTCSEGAGTTSSTRTTCRSLRSCSLWPMLPCAPAEDEPGWAQERATSLPQQHDHSTGWCSWALGREFPHATHRSRRQGT